MPRVPSKLDGRFYKTEIVWLVHKNEFVNSEIPNSVDLRRVVGKSVLRSESAKVTHRVVRHDGACSRGNHGRGIAAEKVCTLHCDLGPAIRGDHDPNLVTRRRNKFTFKSIITGFPIKNSYLEVAYRVEMRVGAANLEFVIRFDKDVQDSDRQALVVRWNEEIAIGLDL